MKLLKSSLMIMFVAVSFVSCNAQTSEDQKEQSIITEDIQVYYFHNTARCATCNAVESETKIALEMFYDKKMKGKE